MTLEERIARLELLLRIGRLEAKVEAQKAVAEFKRSIQKTA